VDPKATDIEIFPAFPGSEVEIDEYRAVERLATLEDLAEFWSCMPGHPDYPDPLFRTTDSSDRAGGQAEAVRLFGSRKLSDHQLSNGA
jgi:hypothetical protein